MADRRRPALPGTAARAVPPCPACQTPLAGTCLRAPRRRRAAAIQRPRYHERGRTAPPSCRPARHGRRALAVHHNEIPGHVVQPPVTVDGANNDVLDPGSVRAWVDARLNGERMPGLEDLGVAGHNVGVLVGLEADAMTGPVYEVVA